MWDVPLVHLCTSQQLHLLHQMIQQMLSLLQGGLGELMYGKCFALIYHQTHSKLFEEFFFLNVSPLLEAQRTTHNQ